MHMRHEIGRTTLHRDTNHNTGTTGVYIGHSTARKATRDPGHEGADTHRLLTNTQAKRVHTHVWPPGLYTPAWYRATVRQAQKSQAMA